jgi:hypothetical protein
MIASLQTPKKKVNLSNKNWVLEQTFYNNLQKTL